MSGEKDTYIEEVINAGDEGSDLLASICAPTLNNSDYVRIIQKGMNGISVLKGIPENYKILVHSNSGDPSKTDIREHTETLVDRLVLDADLVGATPIAFADVVDARVDDKELITLIGNTLVERANKYELAIMNGEYAILGSRVNCQANLSGTMISIIENQMSGVFHHKGINYAAFDHDGKAIYINSDGTGTIPEFYERSREFWKALIASLAMKLDDGIKIGAIAKVVSDVVETKGNIPFSDLVSQAAKLGHNLDLMYILQQENVGERLFGYKDGALCYNVSGSAVSLIDEEILNNPLAPKPGNYLIAIRGKPNPRCNGITGKRETMVEHFGVEWHTLEEAKPYLEYLGEPATIFYPIFKDLINQNLVTSVYHLSGGAYEGKLAKPLSKHNLFVKMENLFEPDSREIDIMKWSGTSVKSAYAKWPMGPEGFVTTDNPEATMEYIRSQGLEPRVVGRLESNPTKDGVEFTAYDGSQINFTFEKAA